MKPKIFFSSALVPSVKIGGKCGKGKTGNGLGKKLKALSWSRMKIYEVRVENFVRTYD